MGQGHGSFLGTTVTLAADWKCNWHLTKGQQASYVMEASPGPLQGRPPPAGPAWGRRGRWLSRVLISRVVSVAQMWARQKGASRPPVLEPAVLFSQGESGDDNLSGLLSASFTLSPFTLKKWTPAVAQAAGQHACDPHRPLSLGSRKLPVYAVKLISGLSQILFSFLKRTTS